MSIETRHLPARDALGIVGEDSTMGGQTLLAKTSAFFCGVLLCSALLASPSRSSRRDVVHQRRLRMAA
jgi:hypothetical protein